MAVGGVDVRRVDEGIDVAYGGGAVRQPKRRRADSSRERIACSRPARYRVLLTAVCLVSSLTTVAGGDDTVERRFLAEAPSGWQRLEDLATGVDVNGVLRFESFGIEGAPPKREESWSFVTHGPLVKVINERPGAGDGQRVFRAYVLGDKFHFGLQKEDASPWLVRYMGPVRREIDQVLMQGVRRFVSAPWAIAGRRLKDLLADERFEVSTVEEVDDGGLSLVAVSFANGASAADGTGVRSGRLLLDASMHWAVRSADLVGSGPLLERVIVRYGANALEKPVIDFVSSARMADDGPEKQELSFTFEKYEYRDVPSSEFTLESFGIDPKRDEAGAPYVRTDGANSRRAASLFIGLFLVAASYMLYRRGRKRSAS